MATATFTREPAITPPATFTLVMSEDEVKTVLGAIGTVVDAIGEDSAYNVFDALGQALVSAGAAKDEWAYGKFSDHVVHSALSVRTR